MVSFFVSSCLPLDFIFGLLYVLFIRKVGKFTTKKDVRLSDDITLWRYMDIWKLEDMIKTSSLFFTSRETNSMLQSVFPVAIEGKFESGVVKETQGSAFLLKYSNRLFVITAAHCVDTYMGHNIPPDYLFFGMIKTKKEIVSIEVYSKLKAVDPIGNILDMSIFPVNIDSYNKMKMDETSSISDLISLEFPVTSTNFKTGDVFTIYGYPRNRISIREDNIKASLERRFLPLVKIDTSSIPLSYGELRFDKTKDSPRTLHGFSGGPVIYKGKVVGINCDIPDPINGGTVRFVPYLYIKEFIDIGIAKGEIK